MLFLTSTLLHEMIVPSKIKSGDEVILIAPSRKVDLPALEFTEALLKKNGN